MANDSLGSPGVLDQDVRASIQPSVNITTVQLCTEGDIIPLIHRALNDEDAQVADPSRGWEGGQVIAVPISGGPAGVPDEQDMLDGHSQEHLSGTTNMDQGNAQNNAGSHKQKGKRERRRRKKLAKDASMCQTKAKLAIKHLPTSIATTLSVDQLHIAQGAYVGKRVQAHNKGVQELDSLLQKGFKLVKWDGCTPHVLLDSGKRIIGVLAGRPKDDSWKDTAEAACDAMEQARGQCVFRDVDKEHRRGRYPCLAVGVSYGGGQQIPGNLLHSKSNRAAIQSLLGNKAIQRLAGFGNSILHHYSPKVHQLYVNARTSLLEKHPSLKWNFRNSAFAAATFNFGPATVTYGHTDNGNFASGMCSITALGNYDPTQGGHLVLFDLGLVIEFPPGSTILIPSAILRHGNVSISSKEKRLSFTQYFAGGLIRWVRYGFRTADDLRKESPEDWQAAKAERETRVQEAALYFSTL
ncbi:hypothetical protein F4604DRAFT_1917243 [Suillus subluteus]|nr:hypothetical protein F4604DRAFT_1917243 [Suillus subluteus]